MQPAGTSIFDFQSCRDFLKHALAHHPKRRRPMSIAQWSRQLQLKSPRTLGMIIQGDRYLSPTLANSIAKDLELNGDEKRMFELMTTRDRLLDKGQDTADIQLEMEQIKLSRRKRKLMDSTFQNQLERWFILAIQQLLPTDEIELTPQSISERFNRKFTPKDAENALRFLVEKGFASYDQDGRLRRADHHPTVSTADVKSEHIQRYHDKMLHLAHDALARLPVADRDFESLTLAYDRQDLPKIKHFIREFRDRFDAKFEQVGSADVGQLSIQFFPLTHT